ncbi:MAG: winged helix-turn-helix domain-containing protein, partial [Muribaculaceae bacterium]|nr:winged helix-turn-helix domain-containing protein [Muribaculaceae bacterium]
LKKATKLKEKEVYAAIGWLAREGKVNVTETETDIEVTLL